MSTLAAGSGPAEVVVGDLPARDSSQSGGMQADANVLDTQVRCANSGEYGCDLVFTIARLCAKHVATLNALRCPNARRLPTLGNRSGVDSNGPIRPFLSVSNTHTEDAPRIPGDGTDPDENRRTSRLHSHVTDQGRVKGRRHPTSLAHPRSTRGSERRKKRRTET